MEKEKVMQMVAKVKKSWKKWNDSAVGKQEKEMIKAQIEKICTKYNLEIDWKTGSVTIKAAGKTQDKQDSKQQESKDKGSKKKEKTPGVWGTKELTEYLNKTLGKELTPKTLRRTLRKMERYNDGVTTHYAWTGENDPLVKEILAQFKGKSA